jgi:hypothetical protein
MFATRGLTLLPALVIACFANKVHDGFAALTNALNTVDSVTVPLALLPVCASLLCTDCEGSLGHV